MVGVVEIKAAYDSAKAAFQIAEGISSLKTEAADAEARAAIGQILSALRDHGLIEL